MRRGTVTGPGVRRVVRESLEEAGREIPERLGRRTGPGRPRTCPDYLVADKGYSSRADRALLRRRGIAHTIPEPRDQQAKRRRKGSAGGHPVGFHAARYTRRNVVERGFCQVKQWRGLAARYDKHARNRAGALKLAALLTWLP
jgi:transposase